MHVAGLAIYPVKGLRPVPLEVADVMRCGLAHDRRWAIVRPGGVVLTQRDLPIMARIDARIEGSTLRLECAGHGGIDATPAETPVSIEVWRTTLPGRAANPAASTWLSAVLGTSCTLVYQDDAGSRPLRQPMAQPGDCVSLADGFPLLVTTSASLAALNRHLALPVPMDRFRPNVVIDGSVAWAEDTWPAIDTPAVRLRLASACARCKVTTLDQRTGDTLARAEPLKTLAAIHRGGDGGIDFGWNAIPDTVGTIRVGDPVTV